MTTRWESHPTGKVVVKVDKHIVPRVDPWAMPTPPWRTRLVEWLQKIDKGMYINCGGYRTTANDLASKELRKVIKGGYAKHSLERKRAKHNHRTLELTAKGRKHLNAAYKQTAGDLKRG